MSPPHHWMKKLSLVERHEQVCAWAMENNVSLLQEATPFVFSNADYMFSTVLVLLSAALERLKQKDETLMETVLQNMHRITHVSAQSTCFQELQSNSRPQDFKKMLLHPSVLKHQVCRMSAYGMKHLHSESPEKEVFEQTLHPREAVFLAKMMAYHSPVRSHFETSMNEWREVFRAQSHPWWMQVQEEWMKEETHIQKTIEKECPEFMSFLVKHDLHEATRLEEDGSRSTDPSGWKRKL